MKTSQRDNNFGTLALREAAKKTASPISITLEAYGHDTMIDAKQCYKELPHY